VSTTEAPCYSTPEQARPRIQTLLFARTPTETRVLLPYLHHPQRISRFYDNAVRFIQDPALRAAEVLANYTVDRTRVCDALERMNLKWGAGKEVTDNITRLRDAKCVAVVSGQQAGLFSGPLYTIYKALSAVKLADCLSQRGTEAVPVFWIATDIPHIRLRRAAHSEPQLTQSDRGRRNRRNRAGTLSSG